MINQNKAFSIFRFPLGRLGKQLVWGMIAGISLLALFAKLVEDLLYHELGNFDAVVGNFVQSFATPRVTKAAIFITTVGSVYVEIPFLLVVGVVLLFRFKHTWETVMLAISFAGGGLLNIILKEVFHRSRPNIRHLVEAGGYSFPSGHSTVAVSFYGMFGYLVWLNLRSKSKSAWYVIV